MSGETKLQSFKEAIFLTLVVLNVITVGIETDIYVPSFPDMLSYFNTSEQKIGFLLSLNFIGLCFSGLIYGPLSDAFGRRKITIISLSIFFIGSLGCVFSPTINLMLVSRFIQGLGAGGIFCIMPAAFFDIYSQKKAMSLLAYLNAIVTTATAGAPILGSWINTKYGWHANFTLIAILNFVALLFTIFFFKETLPRQNRSAFDFISLLKGYSKLSCSFHFLANTIIFSLLYSCIIVYIANLSLIFINNLNVNPLPYSFYQAAILGSFTIFSLFAGFIINKYGMNFSKKIGLFLVVAGSVSLIYSAIFVPKNPLLITLGMATYSSGCAFSMAIFYGIAVNSFPKFRGAANAYAASFRLGITALMVGISGILFTGTIKPVAFIILLSTLTCFILMVVLRIDLEIKKS